MYLRAQMTHAEIERRTLFRRLRAGRHNIALCKSRVTQCGIPKTPHRRAVQDGPYVGGPHKSSLSIDEDFEAIWGGIGSMGTFVRN
jgi:hypothetical protein